MIDGARRTTRRPVHVPVIGALVGLALLFASGEARTRGEQTGGAATLAPTAHPPVPAELRGYWLSPASGTISSELRDFARAVLVIDGGGTDVASVLPLLSSPALDKTPLASQVRYYRGLAAQRLNRLDEARVTFAALVKSAPPGQVTSDAALRLAETHEQQGNYAEAAATYAVAIEGRPQGLDRISHRWGVALERAGDSAGSIAAHRRVYYDYPLSRDAEASGEALARLDSAGLPFEGRVAKELARADALYRARRWSDARGAYARVLASGDDATHRHAAVRIGAVDVQLKQYRGALDQLRPLAADGPHRAEAALHIALAARAQGQASEYARLARQMAAAHPSSPFAEEALNGLATSLILDNEDGEAAEVFAQMAEAFPTGRFAERAAWKAGWWAYRTGNMADAVRHFEAGAANFPRSDYRPAWLYWSARAKERAGDGAGAAARYALTVTDYRNSYYGRLAINRLGPARTSVPSVVAGSAAAGVTPPPTQPQIALLLSLGLHDLALAEIEFARRTWGDSPGLTATAALAQHRAGRLRLGINAMKRAYPQYLAAGGEALPAEVMRILFPLDFWPLIEAHATKRGLDPYLVAALAAQESTFDAEIRSSAGAIGLLQIMPATGRQFARRLGIAPFSTRRLTEADVNAAIGTTYLADLLAQFGGAPYALAGYNAGGHRVSRWRAERPGLPEDEWIDDIPFPETQNYVKRILGTAEDYRRLYGGGVLKPLAPGAAVTPTPTAAPGPADSPRAVPATPTAPAGTLPTRRRTRD